MAKEKTTETRTIDVQRQKLDALEAARAQIDKEFGKGSLMRLGDNPVAANIEVIPSGSIMLDEALGVGGYPRGRVIEIYGPESSGKTTLAIHAIAEAQKAGGIAAFIDAEHALDPSYAKKLGVNTDDLWISQPDSGEQALEVAESLVRSGAVDIIIVDSVAALTPQAEIEGDMGDSHMGLQARLMSQALRKLTAILAKSKTTIIFINQIRMKNRVRVKIVTNKVAPPFRKVELDLMFDEGISYAGGILDGALRYGFIEKMGSWYSFNGDKIGQGRDNTLTFLKQNPDVLAELDSKLRQAMFSKGVANGQPSAEVSELTEI